VIETVKLESVVADVLASTQVVDIHTHLFAPEFGSLGLWGIDHLLTYHYLEAELFRSAPIRPEHYWPLTTEKRADVIWKWLFVENNPISEATRGVIAVLQAFGLDTCERTLTRYRDFFRGQNLPEHLTRVFELAGIESVVMTNDPLDPEEAPLWDSLKPDPRFHAALRLDRLLNHETPYNSAEARRLVETWATRIRAVYMAVSLPDSFTFPAQDRRNQLLTEAVLPVCRDLDIPLSLMIGVRRQVNPAIQLAGDASGRADLRSIETMCREFPGNRFLVSVLSRENQHELCVYARKFANLMPFGCWWFLNNPSMVEEITRERLEMLGTSFIPQHSDARVLEQIIYKWRNTRRTLAPVLANAYRLLAEDGRTIERAAIQRDLQRLFRTNFYNWTSR